MACGVNYWLGLYHKARVVHRDIRLSNILRFSCPPFYTHFRDKSIINVVSPNGDSFLQWQLIDFNLGYCLTESDHVLTKIHLKSEQWKNVGLRVKQLQQANILEIEVSWTVLDDDQMLINLLLPK
jgi:hypothetical protein